MSYYDKQCKGVYDLGFGDGYDVGFDVGENEGWSEGVATSLVFTGAAGTMIGLIAQVFPLFLFGIVVVILGSFFGRMTIPERYNADTY